MHKGRVPEAQSLRVAPAPQATELRFPGLGDEARDPVLPSGALLAQIVLLPHGVYELRDSHCLFYRKAVQPSDATLPAQPPLYRFSLPSLEDAGTRWCFEVPRPIAWGRPYTAELPHRGRPDWRVLIEFVPTEAQQGGVAGADGDCAVVIRLRLCTPE